MLGINAGGGLHDSIMNVSSRPGNRDGGKGGDEV